MYTSKCSDAMPAPLQLSCFCRSCLSNQMLQQQQNLSDSPSKTKKTNKKLNNGDVEEDTSSSHLPYQLSAMVCHLGASLSSGNNNNNFI